MASLLSVPCRICGKELTDPDSVRNGIGPICIKTLKELEDHEPKEVIGSTIAPNEVIIETRFRKELGDLLPLIKSIAKVGLLHPIVITRNKRLVAGERRLEAWKLLYENRSIPITTIPEYITDAEIEENTVRQDFTVSELAAIYKHYKPQIEEQNPVGRPSKENKENFLNYQGQTRDIIGDIAGVSGKTLEKAVTIYDAAQENPELFGELLEKVDKGNRSIHSAYGTVINKQNQLDLQANNPLTIPSGKYRTIVIDPPWPMKKIEREVRPNQGETLEYPTMTIEEIQELPIQALAYEDGCHIYLWTTQKYLPNALECFKAWGIKYQCLLTWLKPGGFTPFSWQYNTEHVLFGQIGSLKLEKLGIKIGFQAERREHSRKPDHFYEMVTQASPEPRLELFSRQTREGFKAWGNEVTRFA